MRWILTILFFGATVCLGSGEELNAGVLEHSASVSLLKKKPIRLEASGMADISFAEACRILQRDDLLEAIQRGYAETLPPGETPEFTVRKLSDGVYHYVNRHQQETRIEEVACTVEEKRAEVALYSKGVRFFGPYESLCQVSVSPSGSDQVTYHILVYARPGSAVFRFFAKMAPIEMFFRHKTSSMTDLVLEVCDRIAASQAGVVRTKDSKQQGGEG